MSQSPANPPHQPRAPRQPASDVAPFDIPAGFRPLPTMGDFIVANGPLYLRHEGDSVQLGFRVERRHTNPLGNCHGGMLASFCDMLLPISIHRKGPEASRRLLPTINLQLDYLAPAPFGAWVEGEAQVLRTTRSLVFAQGLVSADGAICTRVSGIFKIGPPFPGSFEVTG
ncbi:MAG TPA: PaaI family thioesterase [Caldimonas sp.]